MGIDKLLGGVPRDQLAAERAIAEFRAGRPVVVETAAGALLTAPVEGLDSAGVAALAGLAAGGARLVLAGPRLHRLGAPDRAAAALALPAPDLAEISRLAIDDGATLDARLLPLAPGEEAGLRLAHLAALLPALVVVPLEAGALTDAPVVRVAEAAVAAYPARRSAALHIVSRAKVPLEGAPQSEFVIFRGGEGLRDQAAVIIGQPDLSRPVAVRLHSACLTGDLFGSLKCDCGDQLRMTARAMADNGGGVILYLDQEGRGNGLASKIKAYRLQAEGLDTYDADEVLGFDHDQRGFGFAADMLRQLGVSRVKIHTNNPNKIAALAAAGLEVVEQERVIGRRTPQNIGYLAAKRDRAGHSIDAELEPPLV
ncbi:MAG: GTP cyclohydrolase II RibA [Methylobacteriaceae bacterium]|nr:GTP cyclohydrolase II RibA [Methylobacteriaceae bacterium]